MIKKLTEKEFKAIPRNADGDIIWLGDYIFRLTDSQIDRLSEDDWQRYDEEIHAEYC